MFIDMESCQYKSSRSWVCRAPLRITCSHFLWNNFKYQVLYFSIMHYTTPKKQTRL